MFCSSCGFNQSNRESNYCSGCGRSLNEEVQTEERFHYNPQMIYQKQPGFVSMRKNGLKVGGKMILAGLVLVPLFGVLAEGFGVNPVLAGLTALICFWGGFLRMVYAVIFEGNETESLEQKLGSLYIKHIKRKKVPAALPKESVNFANVSYSKQGMWRENSDSGNENGGTNRW